MAWAEPKHTRTRVDGAGKKFTELLGQDWRDEEQADDFEEALEIINNWRSSHSYPLNTFQMGLRRTIRHLGSKTPWLVAQRIKRLPAISLKLKLNKSMQLSQMQDIGGCRAVVSSVRQVNELVNLYKASSMKHELIRVTDYIENPSNTGYRSVHLMYRYHSDKNKASYNGLRIEMQLRSRLQHAWATAVETVGEFIGQALKSNVGQAPGFRIF